jgi:DNA-binding CsgD family transcriptional regulator
MITGNQETEEEFLSRLPTTHLVGMDETVVWHDLFVLIDPRYPDTERYDAARWIAYCWFKKPIAPQRWQVVGYSVKLELEARAKANRTTGQAELTASVTNALFLAGSEPVDLGEPGPRKAFLRKLNNIVVEDLVGPGWRQRHRTVDIGEFQDVLAEKTDLLGELEVALELENRIATARLGPKEAHVVRATMEGWNASDIAASLGTTPASVRTTRSRARTKLRTSRE